MTLYDLVGFGMAAFVRARFEAEVHGALSPERGTLYVVTHRSHLDVPLLIGTLFPRVRSHPDALPWFAVRDDLFLPGFFSHLAPGRIPQSLGIGGILAGRLRCVPVRPATRMRLVDLCRAQPDLPLAGLPHADELCARATRLRRPEPKRARDVLDSSFADLLWRLVQREDAPAAGEAWSARLARSRHDLERLIGLLRAGESLVLFPEGTPSRDGKVGPVQRGTSLLVRRGRPRRIVPIALDYTGGGGRRRAIVRVGAPVSPPCDNVESRVRTLLQTAAGEVESAA